MSAAPTLPTSTASHTVRSFASMAEMVDHVNRYHPRTRGSAHKYADPTYDTFYGTASFEDAECLLRDGWEAGTAGIAGEFADLLPEVAKRITARWDVAGGSVSVPRYLSGDPRHMRRVTQQPTKPVVYIAVAGAFLGGNSVETMLANGRVMVALVDLLTTRGYACHVDLVGTSRPQGYGHGMSAFTVAATIKRANEPLDLGTAAFAIANPSTFRRFVFGVRECDCYAVAAGVFDGPAFPNRSGGAASSIYPSPAAAGYDIDLTTEPASQAEAVRRVLDAVIEWQAKR